MDALKPSNKRAKTESTKCAPLHPFRFGLLATE